MTLYMPITDTLYMWFEQSLVACLYVWPWSWIIIHSRATKILRFLKQVSIEIVELQPLEFKFMVQNHEFNHIISSTSTPISNPKPNINNPRKSNASTSNHRAVAWSWYSFVARSVFVEHVNCRRGDGRRSFETTVIRVAEGPRLAVKRLCGARCHGETCWAHRRCLILEISCCVCVLYFIFNN